MSKGAQRILLAFVLNLAVTGLAAAQPNAQSVEDYQGWLKDNYISPRVDEMERVSPLIEGYLQNLPQAQRLTYWHGNEAAEAQDIAEKDEFIIREEQFTTCNDNRITNVGDPEEESRQNVSCDQQTGFLSRANVIAYKCPLGRTGNACGDDAETGGELVQFCSQFWGACGDHVDNRHPGQGGMTGIAVMEIGGDPDGPFGPCQFYALTATFVEYFTPWVMVNTSRGMMQSAYLSKENVQELLPIVRSELAAAAVMETDPSITLAQKGLAQNLKLDPETLSTGEKDPEVINRMVQSIGALPENMRDAPRLLEQMYARNFSTTWDIRQQQFVYNDVPHFPLDTHRFGTDLPFSLQSVNIPPPTGTFEPIELSANQSQGGNLHSRFISMYDKSGGRLKSNLEQLLADGGPTRCIRHGLATGKIPTKVKRSNTDSSNKFTGLDPKEDTEKFCISKVGPRFPLSLFTYSANRFDATWRALISGGMDLFYAINFREHYDAGPADPLHLARIPGTYHTYLEEFDRISVNTNPRATDPDFAAENPGCKPFKDMVKFNVEYQRPYMPKIAWGDHNTFFVWGYVKAPWGFRGREPKYVFFYNPTIHEQVEYRFR